MKHVPKHQYIKIFVVRLSVCHGNGRGHSLEIFKSYCNWGHSELHATRGMQSWTLAMALAMGKNTRSFSVLDKNEIRFYTYVSQRAEGEAATVTTSD